MAQKCKVTDIRTISMDNARVFDSVLKAFDRMAAKNTWLILQNCHLIGKWPKEILRRFQVKLHQPAQNVKTTLI